MQSIITPEQAGIHAAECFGTSYHCAEAVAAAGLEAFGTTERKAAIRHATPFGGGFGRSFELTCGALSGAMIALGHFHGRKEAGENWDLPAKLGEMMITEFRNHHGTCNCGELRERFGEEQQMQECRKLVQDTTTRLVHLLNRKIELDKEETQG